MSAGEILTAEKKQLWYVDMILADRYTYINYRTKIGSCINTPYLGLHAAVGLIDAVQTLKE